MLLSRTERRDDDNDDLSLEGVDLDVGVPGWHVVRQERDEQATRTSFPSLASTAPRHVRHNQEQR